MSRFVWCEDSRSGFIFWKKLFGTLYPDIIIESKASNSGLRKAVDRINDNDNQYYILMDYALDNPDVLREYKRLSDIVSGKTNTRLIKIQSFEFALLSFEQLDHWVFAEKDKLREKRKDLIEAGRKFVKIIREGGKNDELESLKALLNISSSKNIEQTSSYLLFELTKNTGFETNKSQIGECFVVDCCEWKTRQADDICGLDNTRLTLQEKMEQIADHSIIRPAFKEAGLKHDNDI